MYAVNRFLQTGLLSVRLLYTVHGKSKRREMSKIAALDYIKRREIAALASDE